MCIAEQLLSWAKNSSEREQDKELVEMRNEVRRNLQLQEMALLHVRKKLFNVRKL